MKRASFIVLFFLFVSICLGDTFYVRSSGGNDASDGQEFSRAYATLQYAADATTVSGSLLLVCGSFSPAATVDFDINSSEIAAPITLRGGNASTGADDGSIGVISGASLGASTDLINLAVNNLYINFENMRITGATRDNVVYNADVYVIWKNSRIDSATSDGVFVVDVSAAAEYIDTEIDNNTGWGILVVGDGRGEDRMRHCAIHDNAAGGLNISLASSPNALGPSFLDSFIFKNGGGGIFLRGSAIQQYGKVLISNCTFFSNTGDGAEVEETVQGWIFIDNTIFSHNGGYAINMRGGSISQFGNSVLTNICAYNNNGGGTGLDIDINSNILPGSGHVFEDPSYVSEVDGSEDLSPEELLLYVSVSFPAGASDGKSWIGAAQPEIIAGGGGTAGPLVGPGRLIR